MADQDFATPTFYLVLQKAHREGQPTPSPVHQPYQRRQPVISGTRLDELTQRLGKQSPLVHERGDGTAGRHGE